MAERTILNIGTDDGTTYKLILEGEKRVPLYGLNVGEEFEGEILDMGIDGYTFKITGGSDDTGTPMRREIRGSGRKRLLLKGGVGFVPKAKGERKRKLVRGAEIQDDISQLNIRVVAEGSTPLSEL
jgi:small subunit ribosomal protein S6e